MFGNNSLKKLWVGMNFEPNRIFHVFWAVFGHEDDQSFKIERKIYLQQGPQIKNYFKFIYLHTVGWNDGLVWVWISWASSQHFVDNCYFVQLFCSFLTSCFDDYLIFLNISSPEARNFAPLLTWIFDRLWIDGIFSSSSLLPFVKIGFERFWILFFDLTKISGS